MLWSPIDSRLPKVVILGRPNTGKSTLFNRLLKKRRAITDPTPGVTRDAVEAEFISMSRRFTLYDTGGFTLAKEALLDNIKEKTFSLVRQAALLLLVVDIGGINNEDEEFIEKLRPYRNKIILVVNKIDNPEREMLLSEHYELGFPIIIGVSAEHGRNIEALNREIDAFFVRTPHPDGNQEPLRDPDVKISLLGKPNTGKSTLLNLILQEEKSLTSEVPGTTRDVLEGSFVFKNRSVRILDTAGIRRKNRIENPVEYYSVNRAIKTIEESDVLILLIDAVDGFTDQDKKIAALVEKKGRGIILALGKWDLVPKTPNAFRAMKDRIEFFFPAARTIPIIPVSGKTGEGIDKLLNTVLSVSRELHHRVDTGELNRALAEWKNHYSVPLKKNIRIRYMTQVGTDPVRFVLFVNAVRGFPGSYTHYLKNRIREQFGFRHVPVRIEVKRAVKKET